MTLTRERGLGMKMGRGLGVGGGPKTDNRLDDTRRRW